MILVKDVMKRNVIVAKPEINIREMSQVMSKFHIGCLVIVEKGKTVGVVTERDILNSIANGMNPDKTMAKDIMTKNVITIEPDNSIDDAVELMTKNRIKKLPVVKNGKLVGIVTASDIIIVEPKLIESIANLISIKLPGYEGG